MLLNLLLFALATWSSAFHGLILCFYNVSTVSSCCYDLVVNCGLLYSYISDQSFLKSSAEFDLGESVESVNDQLRLLYKHCGTQWASLSGGILL